MSYLSIASVLLSSLVYNPAPWLKLQANSEQRQPVYIGATPCEMELKHKYLDQPQLSKNLKQLGESFLRKLTSSLGDSDIEFELWPAQNDLGEHTWAIARYRRLAVGVPAAGKPGQGWQWLESAHFENIFKDSEIDPLLPVSYRTFNDKEFSEIFDDFLKFKDLYQKPVFGDCVFTTKDGLWSVGAWHAPHRMHPFKRSYSRNRRFICHAIAQPARFNRAPVSFVVRVTKDNIVWPTSIEWLEEKNTDLDRLREPLRVNRYPASMVESYKHDVYTLSGSTNAEFPITGHLTRFVRKSSADPYSQLETLVDYLQERYEKLGITTYRDRFLWRGIPQSNLIAVIPGSLPRSENKPVLLADHIDTAFSEDAFDQTGRRVANPGADDNVTAIAGLLQAAEILRHSKPAHDIWLVHLTGEEFPADDLGARRLVSKLLNIKFRMGGLVLMDMIGFNADKTNVFQINPGASDESIHMARKAFDAAAAVAPRLKPVIRKRFDEKSYLFNTDGLIFSDAGYPVILLNENLNRLDNIDRPHYHKTTDTPKTLDWDYAISIVRVAIETVARLANAQVP